MKTLILKLLHFVFGYERYTRLFSIFKIRTLSFDSRKTDFLFFETLLAADANVLVIGACTGITTVPLAKGKTGRKVIAYEPLSSNFKVLNQVVSHYRLSNVSTFQLGLGNRSEQREMVLPVLNGVKKQGMAHVIDPSIVLYNEGISEPIELDFLDNRSELKQLEIKGIKLVAENFEYQIIEGAENLIASHRPLIYCELWHNEKRDAVLELIQRYGYTVFYRDGNELLPYNHRNYSGKNFFFKPTDA